MWLLAFAVWLICKGVTWNLTKKGTGSLLRAWSYFVGWPGMDPAPFCNIDPRPIPAKKAKPADACWRYAVIRTICGAVFTYVATQTVLRHRYAAAWLGMIATVLLLHFGLFDLLAIAWRARGIPVEPIMQHPMRATSLADFWSRWNRGFRDLAFKLIFRPLHRRVGIVIATLATFLFSGLVHDLVISVPAHGGYGLPTIYFLIQGFGILFEKSAIGRHTHPKLIRTLMYVALIAPLPLLFHRPFIENVYVPFVLFLRRCLMTGMISLVTLIRIGGVMHFGILIASALTPQVLDWKRELQKLNPLTRQLVWVHGIFIVLTIIALGTIATTNAPQLALGGMLARFVCGFVALFWLARLSLQFALFDPREYLTSATLKLGYHSLTFVFAYLAVIFGIAAVYRI
jgi:hypothetical protein